MRTFRQYAQRHMAFTQTTRPRLLAALLLAAGVALLGIGTKEKLSPASYDSLHIISLGNHKEFADKQVVIVYLDLVSYLREHQDPNTIWSRGLHARLLDRLTAQGARAVVFDIVFSKQGDEPAQDDLFAAALKANARTILAAEHSNKNSHETSADESWARFTVLETPYERFIQAAAGWGVASMNLDDDFVVRKHLPPLGPDQLGSLSLTAARLLGTTNSFSHSLWVRYYGPALTLPHVSYSEALAENDLPPGFFKNKIVFIGARSLTTSADAKRDEFRSPFHSWNNREYFMPGVEVHATQLLNLLRGDALKRLPNAGENFLLIASALLFGGGLLWLRPVPATIIAGISAGLVLAVSLAGFSANIWFPWLAISAVQIPAALFGSWLWQFQEWFFTRRKMEAAKKIADAKIREQAALLDKAHDAILVQSLDGKILYANPSAEKLFGAAKDLFAADSATADKARATALKDGEWNGEIKLQTADGSLVIAASRWTLIRDEKNQPEALLLINSDITEKKNLEQQFLRTQRMNTIGTLAGGMAHDLNNALSPVLLGAQLLRRKTTSEDDRKLLSLIETSANRGADMVRQVLLFARGRGGEFERLELGPLVKELEKMVRETFSKNIAVETFVPRDLWPVQGNLTQLHQVLLNLCVNARDAMPDGGKLSFVADNVELSAEEVDNLQSVFITPATSSPSPLGGERAGVRGESVVGRSTTNPASSEPSHPSPLIPLPSEGRGKPAARASVKFISLLVSDTGTGMPPEVQAKIFEPFFTTKGEGKGTGIGLATVMRILKSHGGFLRLESEVGQGTTFEVFIPCAPQFVAATAMKSATTLPHGNGELILLADDEQALCELVAAELTEFGYRVITAANGAEAISIFKQHASEVRLLITDNSMPIMTGPQVIAEIRKLNPKLPVILASGEGSTSLKDVAELEKPFALADLLNTVNRNLK